MKNCNLLNVFYSNLNNPSCLTHRMSYLLYLTSHPKKKKTELKHNSRLDN